MCARLRSPVPVRLQEDEALNEMAQLVQLQSAQVQELDAECVMLRGCLECVLWPAAPVHPIRLLTLGLKQSRPGVAMSQRQCAIRVSWPGHHLALCSFAASHLVAASRLSMCPPVLPVQACREAMPGAPAAAGAAAAPR